jgi:hypothetical protein
MILNCRHFKAGPDLMGRAWQVDLLWLQTAVAIRHSDSVDVKFLLSAGGERAEKVVSMRHPDLLELTSRTGRPLTDSWCIRLAAQHLARVIESGNDSGGTLILAGPEDLAGCDALLGA